MNTKERLIQEYKAMQIRLKELNRLNYFRNYKDDKVKFQISILHSKMDMKLTLINIA